jgi:propionate CoA-transferase
MSKVLFLSAEEAVKIVKDGDTVTSSGFVGSAIPEALIGALERRFLETGSPQDLTYFYCGSQGNRDGRGGDHMAHKGLTKRAIAGHYQTAPALGAAILNNEIEGYNLPQGVLSQLTREIAGHRPGVLTHVGLGTFVDPRLGGGKLNTITKEDLVEVIDIHGEEKLFYKAFPINVAFLRGSYADEDGNVTMEREIAEGEVTSLSQATRNSGGKVIVQVERIVKAGTLDPRMVKVHRSCVDVIVVADPRDHEQSYGCAYDPAVTGEIKVPVNSLSPRPLSAKKVIGRRGAMEIKGDVLVNLGIGIPEYIAAVAGEEGIEDRLILSVEAGPTGGIPAGGAQFGASMNAEMITAHHTQFDFYDGGGVDMAFLGLAEADERGNVNVSKFGVRLAGCGGFINISQNAKALYFCGTFTAGGLEVAIGDGTISIVKEGANKKFRRGVEQITFGSNYAIKTGQTVKYITERAVFELRPDGLYLTEVAPGIDLRKHILDQMDFRPKMDGAPQMMDSRLFRQELMGLA